MNRMAWKFLFVFTFLPTKGGLAQEAPKPTFEVGDTYRYCLYDLKTDQEKGRCFTLEYKGKRSNGESGVQAHVFLYNDTAEEILTENMQTLRRDVTNLRFEPHNFSFDFPLSVGKAWRGTYDVVPAQFARSSRTKIAKVTGYLEVTVPAGTFKAFKVEYANWLNQQGVTRPADEVMYWCPAVNWYCLYESEAFNSERVKLVEFKRGKPK